MASERSSSVKVSTYRVALFTRQMAVLVRVGVPLLRSLDVLSSQCEDVILKEILETIGRKVASGSRLSEALSLYPRVFNRVFVGLIRSAESSGRLVASLENLALMLERESAMLQRLKSALTYPVFVIGATSALTLFVFTTILPNFVIIFHEMNAQLPLITKFLILLTDLARTPASWTFALGAGLNLYVGLRHQARTDLGRIRLYRVLDHVPFLGSCLKLASLARFCWILEGVLGTGVPLLTCIKLATASCGSVLIMRDSERFCQSISQGDRLSDYFRAHCDLYHPMIAEMVSVGEESSTLVDIFARLAQWFNQELEGKLEMLGALIEPLLMIAVSVMVGTVVIAIFLPLYGLIGQLAN